jgi:hypothetical protein
MTMACSTGVLDLLPGGSGGSGGTGGSTGTSGSGGAGTGAAGATSGTGGLAGSAGSSGDGGQSGTGGIAGATGTGGSGAGPVGAHPSVAILHPSDNEMRVLAQPVPCTGTASDPEDGALGDGSVVWTSSLEGNLSTALAFDWTPSQVGTHEVRLTATDSDGNTGSDSITVFIVAP